MALKRYLIFVGTLYGAAMGGWEQFQADAETAEEARHYVDRVTRGEQDVHEYGGSDPAFPPYRLPASLVCWQIVDSETRSVLASGSAL